MPVQLSTSTRAFSNKRRDYDQFGRRLPETPPGPAQGRARLDARPFDVCRAQSDEVRVSNVMPKSGK